MSNVKIHVGCTGFNYDDWIGGFYPKGIDKQELLGFYSTQFTTCEINSTFYAFPKISSTNRWARLLPDDFVLTAKLPKDICQAPNIATVQEKLSIFLRIMSPLKKNLGPLVCQFAPNFAKTEATTEQLKNFISFYPLDEFKLILEFRHPTWFNSETYGLLNDNELGIVSSYLPYIDVNLYDEVKKDFFYLRMIGSHQQEIGYGKEVIDRVDLMTKTADLLKKGFTTNPNKKSAFVFINNHFSGYAPPAAQKMKDLLEERKLEVIKPKKEHYKGQRKLESFFG